MSGDNSNNDLASCDSSEIITYDLFKDFLTNTIIPGTDIILNSDQAETLLNSYIYDPNTGVVNADKLNLVCLTKFTTWFTDPINRDKINFSVGMNIA